MEHKTHVSIRRRVHKPEMSRTHKDLPITNNSVHIITGDDQSQRPTQWIYREQNIGTVQQPNRIISGISPLYIMSLYYVLEVQKCAWHFYKSPEVYISDQIPAEHHLARHSSHWRKAQDRQSSSMTVKGT